MRLFLSSIAASCARHLVAVATVAVWIPGAEAKDIKGASVSFTDAAAPECREVALANVNQMLATELSWLQSDPTGTAALTIEIQGAPHYLQFIGNELIFDLPEAALAPDVFGRARSVMERLSIPRSTITVTTETGEVQTLGVFQQSMAGELDGAVRVALAVLKDIYLADAQSVVRITRIR